MKWMLTREAKNSYSLQYCWHANREMFSSRGIVIPAINWLSLQYPERITYTTWVVRHVLFRASHNMISCNWKIPFIDQFTISFMPFDGPLANTYKITVIGGCYMLYIPRVVLIYVRSYGRVVNFILARYHPPDQPRSCILNWSSWGTIIVNWSMNGIFQLHEIILCDALNKTCLTTHVVYKQLAHTTEHKWELLSVYITCSSPQWR
jgi:hypothetical protein